MLKSLEYYSSTMLSQRKLPPR